MSVLFATKCWEGDWKKVAFGGMKKKYEAIAYPFDQKILIINNVIDGAAVRSAYGDEYAFAHRDVIKQEFKLSELPNVYAVGEMQAVRSATRYAYLCYIQGDCVTSGGDWVTPGIKILESEPDVMVVSPLSEVNTWHDAQGYDHYMSDQAWLIRVKDFLNPEVYLVEGVDPDYPDYGGNSFEAMVGKYLKKSGKKRKILSEFYAHHPQY